MCHPPLLFYAPPFLRQMAQKQTVGLQLRGAAGASCTKPQCMRAHLWKSGDHSPTSLCTDWPGKPSPFPLPVPVSMSMSRSDPGFSPPICTFPSHDDGSLAVPPAHIMCRCVCSSEPNAYVHITALTHKEVGMGLFLRRKRVGRSGH